MRKYPKEQVHGPGNCHEINQDTDAWFDERTVTLYQHAECQITLTVPELEYILAEAKRVADGE